MFPKLQEKILRVKNFETELFQYKERVADCFDEVVNQLQQLTWNDKQNFEILQKKMEQKYYDINKTFSEEFHALYSVLFVALVSTLIGFLICAVLFIYLLLNTPILNTP